MKLVITIASFFLFSFTRAQVNLQDVIPQPNPGQVSIQHQAPQAVVFGKIKIDKNSRWHMTRNKYITGGLLFIAGAAKGLNESLQFHYFGFEHFFPDANDQWFYPAFSYRNKFKDGDPEKGAKFPLSTSVLVCFTDQYHLNNLIQRSALTAALVIKIGEGKKPFKHYIFDLLYYTVCHQAGFHSIFTPIRLNNDR